MDKAGDLLKNMSFFSRVNLEKAEKYSGMFNSWSKIAGLKLGEYSRIADISRNALVVEVDHPAIMQMLQFKYSEILEKINRKYPELVIRELRMFLKNTDFKEGCAKNLNNLPGDMEGKIQKESGPDLEKIDNNDFRELLLNMKKRSQV